MEIGKTNVRFGWAWLVVGFLSGAVLGLFFMGDNWLGGYGSFPRRLFRLGHVAAIALSLLNILYGMFIDSCSLGRAVRVVGSRLMIAGAVAMPIVCALTAAQRGFYWLFPIPVFCLVGAACVMAYGQIKGGSS